jgi:hypothetical protein
MSPDTAERSPAEGSVLDGSAGSDYVETSVPPATDADRDDIAAQLRRRREASWRLPPLKSGYRDPLDHLRSAS